MTAPSLPDLAPRIQQLIEDRIFIPGGRYLHATGRRYPQVNNCMLFRAEEDSREEWGRIMDQVTNCLMTGGGVGVVYSRLRPEGAPVQGMGGKSTGPCALMQMVNESGRFIMQGGSRRSALWAGLHWNHPDVFKFIALKEWSPLIQYAKRQDFNFPAPMDGTNISVILDDAFFTAYGDHSSPDYNRACDVYWACIRSMLRTGEPGFSVDCGENEGENLRNACTEATSCDNGDMCNLASINLARCSSLSQFGEAVELGIAFLVCGTLYSKLPLPMMYKVREKNRRIGLGLMGVHEWLLKRGLRYEASDELTQWLNVYRLSGAYAHRFEDRLSISRSIATRSVAPNGTIGIAAETTPSADPLLAVAYKRRYLDGHTWKYQYVVDPTARRLVDNGVPPDEIEDSYTLAADVERRVAFQAYLQSYVDQGISSTINLPSWGSPLNNEGTVTAFGNTLMVYLPRLRGVTVYPQDSRGGQPLVRVPYTEALSNMGREYVEGGEGQDQLQALDALAQNSEACKFGFCSG